MTSKEAKFSSILFLVIIALLVEKQRDANKNVFDLVLIINIIPTKYSTNIKMNNKVKIKFIEQRWEGFEAWIGNDNSYWVRLDFLLEYFISSNVNLSQKFKGQLDDSEIVKKYYKSLFNKFMMHTSNGKEFNYDDYMEWQKNNKIEVERTIKSINL